MALFSAGWTSLSLESGSTLKPGIPRSLFAVHVVGFTDRHDYAVSSDGQRFLVNTVPEDTSFGSLNLVLNWISEVKQ